MPSRGRFMFGFFVALLYSVWIVTTLSLILCSWRLHKQVMTIQESYPYFLGWLLLSFLIFIHIVFFFVDLRGGRDLPHAHDREKALTTSSLFAGFLIAIPAATITILAFVTAFPHFFEALNAKGSDFRLLQEQKAPQASAAKTPKKRFAYLVAVDVSKSALRSRADPELRSIKDFVRLLFSYDSEGRMGNLVRQSDAYAIYAFAGKQELLTDDTGQPTPFQGTLNKSGLPDQFDSEIAKYLGTGSVTKNDITPAKTDIISFLEYVIAKTTAIHEHYEHVTAIVFSDFRHDPEESATLSEIDERVRSTMENAREMENFQIVGIKMGEDSRGAEKHSSGEDVRPFLRTYGENIWRELRLKEFGEANRYERQAMLIFNIYREVKSSQPVYLKYQLHPRWQPIVSTVSFPNDDEAFDKIALALQTPQDGDGAVSKIKVAFGTDRKPFVLGVGVDEPSFKIYPRMKSTNDPLEIRLDSPLDVSRSAEFDLLVAIPAHSEVRSIRLVVLPAIGDIPMKILQGSLLFLALVGILLAIRIIVWQFRAYRPAAAPATAQSSMEAKA
jgi:hypothetical protein